MYGVTIEATRSITNIRIISTRLGKSKTDNADDDDEDEEDDEDDDGDDDGYEDDEEKLDFVDEAFDGEADMEEEEEEEEEGHEEAAEHFDTKGKRRLIPESTSKRGSGRNDVK